MAWKGQKKIAASIPTASMADIAFLLIIFFMVTTVFDVDKTSVKLPISFDRAEVPRGAGVIVIAKLIDPATNTEQITYKFTSGSANSEVIPFSELYARGPHHQSESHPRESSPRRSDGGRPGRVWDRQTS